MDERIDNYIDNLTQEIGLIEDQLRDIIAEVETINGDYWTRWKAKNESIRKLRKEGKTEEFPGEVAPVIDIPNKAYPLNVYFTLKRYSKRNNYRKSNPKAGQRIDPNKGGRDDAKNERFYTEAFLRKNTPEREWEALMLIEWELAIRPARAMYAAFAKNRKILINLKTKLSTTKGNENDSE